MNNKEKPKTGVWDLSVYVKPAVRLLFFIFTWLFLWLMYGDVLYQLQERSLWFFASIGELKSLSVPLNPFTYIARAILTLCTLPWLGALAIALMLSLTEIATDSLLGLNRKYFCLSYIPSLVLFFMIFEPQYELFFQFENADFLKAIILTFAVISILAAVRCLFFRRNQSKRIQQSGSSIILFANFLAIVVTVFLAVRYSARDDGFRRLTKIQYNVAQQKWGKIISLAEGAKEQTKPITAYYAIALLKTGQIGDRLFNVHHEYRAIPIPKRGTIVDGEGLLFNSEVCYFSGLITPAYHEAMEQMIRCGANKYAIKMMAKAAVVNQEKVLANRLLDIIAKMPFEKKFVERYRHLTDHPEDLAKDSEIAPIEELRPQFESFEQLFGVPFFIQFYSKRADGPQNAVDAELAARLYVKDIAGFMGLKDKLVSRHSIPKSFQQALTMVSIVNNDPSLLQRFKITRDVYNEVKAFMDEVPRHSGEKDQGKQAMRSRFGRSYMYYNTFENIGTRR